jgi:hypothetical protein
VIFVNFVVFQRGAPERTTIPVAMESDFTHLLASWQNFYLLVGTGAATFIGLMFVAVTFGASLITAETDTAETGTARSFLDPALFHFMQVLFTACLLLIPTIGPAPLGVLLAGAGVFRLATLVRVYRNMRVADARAHDIEWTDWMSGIVVPLVAYTGLVGAGIAFVTIGRAFDLLAIVTIVILFNAIYTAWELLIWLALTRLRGGNTGTRN